ncbi:MAG: hypothetical protein OEW18_01130 [Candidatus Aminicenantes bacterium]|nr:hypothetical protein [Candidatus Aminicenantes bacterium]
MLEPEGQVGYRHGLNGAELERMDYLEFIASVTSHILDKGQVTVRNRAAPSRWRFGPSSSSDIAAET